MCLLLVFIYYLIYVRPLIHSYFTCDENKVQSDSTARETERLEDEPCSDCSRASLCLLHILGWADWVPGEDLCLAYRQPPSHCALSWKRVSSQPFPSCYKDTNSTMGPLPLWSHLNLFTSQSSHLQIPLHLELRLQHMNLRGNIQICCIDTKLSITTHRLLSRE